MPNNKTNQAIINMRLCLESAERSRKKVAERKDKVIKQKIKEFQKTKRLTFDSLEETASRVADQDLIAKYLIEDEQLYRGLTIMYAEVAQAELALAKAMEFEQTSNRLRDVGPSRA